jgi:HEAT repeat protein
MSLTLDERQTIWDTFCRTLTSDANPSVRAKAAEALGRLGNAKFIPILLQALTDESPLIRHTVIQALGQIGSTESIPALIIALTDRNPEISAAAAISLGQIRAATAIPDLIQALNAPDSIVRSSSAQALGQIGSDVAVLALLDTLQADADSTVMNSIVDALVTITKNDPTSIDLIQNTAKNIITRSTNSQLRQSAIILLGEISIADAIPELIELLKDADPNVVRATIEALGNAAA